MLAFTRPFRHLIPMLPTPEHVYNETGPRAPHASIYARLESGRRRPGAVRIAAGCPTCRLRFPIIVDRVGVLAEIHPVGLVSRPGHDRAVTPRVRIAPRHRRT